MAKAIPDRWTDYKACGTVIEGTSFVCFKVPLRKAVQQNKRALNELWDIETLVAKVPGLGAVIDLTNTARYYDPSTLKTAGVLHKKILIPGREVPSEIKVKEFKKAVDEFLKLNPGMIIGVHCTHGLNRTGYMVCRYMRDRLAIPAEDAIEKFETARGYHIERKNYIADLIGDAPLPPDIGPHTEVKPVRKQKTKRFEIDMPDNLDNVYPDKLKACLNDGFKDATYSRRIRSSNDTQEGRSSHPPAYPYYVKPGDVERPRLRGKIKSVNKPDKGNSDDESKKDTCLSWRKRTPDDEDERDFHSFGHHRPRQSASASGSCRNSSASNRKMYGRPSANSSKYSFDYRYDY